MTIAANGIDPTIHLGHSSAGHKEDGNGEDMGAEAHKDVLNPQIQQRTDAPVRQRRFQIAESSEGGMRDALSLLDQSISYSTDDVISEDDVLAVSGNISSQIILHMLKEALESNSAEVLKSLGEIISDGKEIPRIIS